MSMPNHVERQGLVCRYLIVKTVGRTSDPFAMTSPDLAPWPSETDEQFLFLDTVSSSYVAATPEPAGGKRW